MNMGYSFMQMRKMDKALKVYNSVIKMSPSTREAYLKAASVLRDLGRQPEVGCRVLLCIVTNVSFCADDRTSGESD
jgi:hypothetical protein